VHLHDPVDHDRVDFAQPAPDERLNAGEPRQEFGHSVNKVSRQVLELLRWFDIPVSAHEDVAKAVISLSRATGGDDDYVQGETARRQLALRRQRTLEVYRDGLCDRAFRDRSLAAISEEEGRWDHSTSTPGMSPLPALELVRGFAAAIQDSNPDAQREVVELAPGAAKIDH
jgi:hypothetical protein